MNKQRNIGQEILTGIKEIKTWQRGQKKLKVTAVALPGASQKLITNRPKNTRYFS